jgi:hypothetical protein
MDARTASEHAEHLRHAQDHHRWRADHMRALAVLRRIEAHILDHEAEIAAHDAEIAAHEEAIGHGGAHAPAPASADHGRLAAAHAEGSRNHDALIAAVLDLRKLLD